MLALLAFSGIGVAIPALSADGIIVITRDVHPRVATRPSYPDPDPKTVNTNPSATVIRAVNAYELNDSDFARITSGSALQGTLAPGGQLPGLDRTAPFSGQGLPGIGGGQSGGGGSAGSNIVNPVNRSLQQGLAPLKILTGDR